jgi:penicillin-binding protein 1C
MNLLLISVKILIQTGSPLVKLFKIIFSFKKRKRANKKNEVGKFFKKYWLGFEKFRVGFLKNEIRKINNFLLRIESNFEKKRALKKKKIREKAKEEIKELKEIKKIEEKYERKVLSKKGIFLALTTVFVLLLAGSYFYLEIIKELPNVDLIYSPPNLSTKILDRNGKTLYKFYRNENRTWVSLEKIPTKLIEATLAIEDKNFYKHYGISIKGIGKAIIYNFKKDKTDKVRGGSTISQQLVKNVFFSGEKTLKRKIKEAILTLVIEKKLDKDEILERYLNEVSYGGEAYGVEEAAQKYFGKAVWELNINEVSYLAGLPAAPSSYSPYGNNPELGFLRQKRVIEEMKVSGFLNEEEIKEIEKEELVIKNNNKEIKAPHFVFYIKNLLEEQGYVNFERQGLLIKTSLDLNLQKDIQKIVSEEIKKNQRLNISNGGALIVDVKNGDILVMVGSKDYYADDIDGKYNVTTALRQPGSSIKPINYLLALENNFSLASVINDSPVSYSVAGQKPYSPRNYNGKYMGEVTLRTALGSSLNVPSVKLLEKNGVEGMINLGEKMGISTWKERNRFGLSLALGSGEVKMTELAGAYSIFANLGQKIEINPILEIRNYLGENVYEKKVRSKKIIKKEHAYMINSVLSDNRARSPIFGSHSQLVIKDRTVAVKTGTTNSLRDNWCIGWTPSFLVASWVGNNDNSPMSWVASGVSGATPIWNQSMNLILKEKENEEWLVPNGLIKKNICGREEWFLAGSEIKNRCPVKEDKEKSELATN